MVRVCVCGGDTRVDCDHKINEGRPAMFLSLLLLNTCLRGECFVYWSLSRKSDKPHSFKGTWTYI